MIDEKFSAQAFNDAGYGTAGARELCRQLQLAVLEELEPALAASMHSIIERLNAMGHSLQPYGPQGDGEKHYRETDPQHADPYRFLIALDTVISVGYPDTTDGDTFP